MCGVWRLMSLFGKQALVRFRLDWGPSSKRGVSVWGNKAHDVTMTVELVMGAAAMVIAGSLEDRETAHTTPHDPRSRSSD